MRIQSELKRYNFSRYTTWPNNTAKPPVNLQLSDTRERKLFQRSDILKVTPKDGWREPTPYSSNDVLTDHCSYQRLYDNYTSAGSALREIRSETGSVAPHDSTSIALLIPASGTPSLSTRNMLYYKALRDAKDQLLNVAVALAELGDSVDMVYKNLTQLVNAFTAAKNRDWPRVLQILGVKKVKWKKASKDVSGRWLEVSFGWLPLLQDIHNAIDEVGRKNEEEGFMIVARAFLPMRSKVESFQVNGQCVPVIPDWTVTGAYSCKFSATRQIKELYKAALWFTVDMPRLKRAAALGLTNPGSVMWELVPLSFVADWVLPIGDWINSLDSSLGLKYKGGTVSWSYRAVHSVDNVFFEQKRNPSGSPTANILLQGGSGSYSRIQSQRWVLEDNPPPLYVKNPFDLWKATTTVALVRQRFR